MNKLRAYLPDFLEATGLASAVIFAGIAFLSLDNPLLVVVFVLMGAAGFALLFSVASLTRNVNLCAEATRRMQADLRAAIHSLQQLADDAANRNSA